MLEKLPNEVGEALKTARPGLGALTFNDDALEDVDVEILLTSPAFAAGGAIPMKYTADGEGISPPLEWTGVPDDIATSLLLIEDADSPTPEPMVHAIVVQPAGSWKGPRRGSPPQRGAPVSRRLDGPELPPEDAVSTARSSTRARHPSVCLSDLRAGDEAGVLRAAGSVRGAGCVEGIRGGEGNSPRNV